MLNFIQWLFSDVIIHRNIFPLWYIATGIILVISILLAILMQLKKFGFFIMITAAAMSTIWELILFAFGLRAYENPLAQIIGPIPELIYHSFSETAATILLGLLIIYKLGIIDLDKYKDNNWKLRKKK
ncbi:MAG: hypothetical protein ACTSQJ_01915 [Promethearchaeota archaeon]